MRDVPTLYGRLPTHTGRHTHREVCLQTHREAYIQGGIHLVHTGRYTPGTHSEVYPSVHLSHPEVYPSVHLSHPWDIPGVHLSHPWDIPGYTSHTRGYTLVYTSHTPVGIP